MHYSYTVVRFKQDTEPWMCSEILDLIKQRDHYLKISVSRWGSG